MYVSQEPLKSPPRKPSTLIENKFCTLDFQRTLTVQQLPDLLTDQSYECHFAEYASQATKNGDMLDCVTPPSNKIPAIEPGGKQLLRRRNESLS